MRPKENSEYPRVVFARTTRARRHNPANITGIAVGPAAKLARVKQHKYLHLVLVSSSVFPEYSLVHLWLLVWQQEHTLYDVVCSCQLASPTRPPVYPPICLQACLPSSEVTSTRQPASVTTTVTTHTHTPAMIFPLYINLAHWYLAPCTFTLIKRALFPSAFSCPEGRTPESVKVRNDQVDVGTEESPCFTHTHTRARYLDECNTPRGVVH